MNTNEVPNHLGNILSSHIAGVIFPWVKNDITFFVIPSIVSNYDLYQ